jgi:uncharacterized membrane protein
MSLAPLLAAPWLVQVHVAAALAAIVLGLMQFIGRKGTAAHRLLGWCWVVLLAVVALSSFSIWAPCWSPVPLPCCPAGSWGALFLAGKFLP